MTEKDAGMKRGGKESIPISSLSLPTGRAARQHLGTKKSQTKQVHPGYSMFEWNKVCQGSRDMAGTRGRLLKVTPEELARHSSDADLWTSVRGVVYNVTQFLKYHPGGKAQLMLGAGKDCTALFDKVHIWVNSEAILKACVVGVLVRAKLEHPVQDMKNNQDKKSLLDQALLPRKDDADLQISIPVPTNEHITGESFTATKLVPITEVPVPKITSSIPDTRPISVPSIVMDPDVQVFIPVPTSSTQHTTGESFSIPNSITYTEMSIPVPCFVATTSSTPDPQSSISVPCIILNPDVKDSTPISTSNTQHITGESIVTSSIPVPSITPVTSSIPVPSITPVTSSIPVPSIAPITSSTVPTFRTHIQGNYTSRHPLISRTAYESEV